MVRVWQLIRLKSNLSVLMKRFDQKETGIEMEKTDNVHLEMVNPRICLLVEGRSFRSALLVLWVSQVKNPVIISIVGISLQSVTNSSKGIYNRCGPRKNNLTHTDFDPIVEFKIFSRGFRTIFDMFI